MKDDINNLFRDPKHAQRTRYGTPVKDRVRSAAFHSIIQYAEETNNGETFVTLCNFMEIPVDDKATAHSMMTLIYGKLKTMTVSDKNKLYSKMNKSGNYNI